LGTILGIIISLFIVAALGIAIMYTIKKKKAKSDTKAQEQNDVKKPLLPKKEGNSFKRTLSRVRRKSFGTPDTFDSGFGKGVEEWVDATPNYETNYGAVAKTFSNVEK